MTDNLPVPLDPGAAHAQSKGWRYANLDADETVTPPEVLALMEGRVARQYNVVPIEIKGGREIFVACENPDDLSLRQRLSPLFGNLTLRFVYADAAAIRRRIEKVYSARDEASRLAGQRSTRRKDVHEGGDLGRIEGGAEGDNKRLLDLVLEQALRDKASDVHIEPTEEYLVIRYRIDGKLRVVGTYPHARAEGLINLIKVEAEMKTDNKLVPDSGVMIFRQQGAKPVDMRVETAPTAWGQSAVMRLQSDIWRPLDTLGFSPTNEKRFRDAIAQPFGIILATGPTGSGKFIIMSTCIPTPSGNTTMGALRVGDEVLGRDGKPCRVTGLSPVNEHPDLYRVKFSDGQEILADADHQWLVSDHHGRNVPRTKKRLAAVARHNAAHEDAADLIALGERWTGRDMMTASELHALITRFGLDGEYGSPYTVTSALDVTDCPRENGQRPLRREDSTTRTQTATVYPVEPILEALANSRSKHAPLAASLLASQTSPPEADCVEIGTWFGVGNWLAQETVKRIGLTGRKETRTDTYTRQFDGTVGVVEYPTDVALKALALRLQQRFSDAPSTLAALHRLTTSEMLARGINLSQGHSNFAVPVTAALDLPDADLPVDPYVFGAWLGDGSTGSGGFTQGAVESCTDDDGLTDQRYLCETLETAGYPTKVGKNGKAISTRGLAADLRQTGAFNEKHIPMTYLRASAAQRLAVLQGLMDTDGTISTGGACELSLSDKRLATDALNLIRSLGIKASASWDRPAGYKDGDGNLVECKNRHRIKFTTDQPVFRLPRKAARIPDTLRETQGWLYITDIEPVLPGEPGYEPGRCITVDNDDHTYLCGDGYVVTSNSTTLYSALRERISPEQKIITLENPIEYKAPDGLSQMAINDAQGLTFAGGLRSILRQDPDIILVGEIRDTETAETAVDAAMTGHLVFSTLHTNDAPGAIPRLMRMEIEPLLVADSLVCVVGQRLVRRLCPTCRITRPADIDSAVEWGFDADLLPPEMFEQSPEGCNDCRHTGWAGRTPIHEVMLLSDDLVDAIATEAPQSKLAAFAREAGMTTMREDGFHKAIQGHTTLAEINASTRRSLA